MVLNPAHWVKKLMQLTKMSLNFKIFLIFLGLIYFAVAWGAEHYLFHGIARNIGRAKQALTKNSKKRKEYKVIRESMKT